jgi:hypothetical protein
MSIRNVRAITSPFFTRLTRYAQTNLAQKVKVIACTFLRLEGRLRVRT